MQMQNEWMYNNLEITKLPTQLNAMNNYDQLDPRSKLTEA